MTIPLPNPPAALIVTADDFGFGLATSRGIIAAHRAGVVTSTSLMAVTGDRAAESVALLADAPKLEIGLHLVLTGPVLRPLAAGHSSGLVGRDGAFLPLPRILLRAWQRRISPNAVFDEVCAQADKAKTLLGRRPDYVDGHHHAHQLPGVREALVDAVRQGNLPPLTRCTAEPPRVRANVPGQLLRRRVMHGIGSAARPVFAVAGIKMNDACFGIIGAKQLRAPNPWSAYLPHLPSEGVVEWFVHPGEFDETLVGRDSYITPRVTELAALVKLSEHPDWPRWAKVLTTKAGLATTPDVQDGALE